MTRNCDYYQAQVLEHLYGLLNPEESLTLIEHAGRCEDCREVLHKADSQKRLIAAAARAEFSHVQFQAPKGERVARLASPAQPPREVTPLTWTAWVAAAVILLAVGGITLGGRYASDFFTARQKVDLAQQRIDQLRKGIIQVEKDYDDARIRTAKELESTQVAAAKLEADQKRELDAIEERLKKLDMYVRVIGPENVRSGESAQFRIETMNFKNQPEPAKLSARIREQTTGRIIYEEKDIASTGAYVLNLTPDVTLKGGSHLALEVVAVGQEGNQGELKEQLTLIRSAYVTQLTTDKPMYQPGETLRFRSLTLDRYTFKPTPEDLALTFTLLNPQGQQVYHQLLSTRLHKDGKDLVGPDKLPLRGVAAGEFVIPDHFVGGEYTLLVQDQARRFPPEKRKFVLNRYQKPRLNKELKNFDKRSYGPGDEVIANLEVTRAEGGLPLAGMPVTANVTVDGKAYRADGTPATNPAEAEIRGGTDAFGKVVLKFKLPASIDKGDASLSVQFTDGSSFEALVKPIPIVVKKLQVHFFPEGGDLVAGVPNRVYFQVRTPLDKAADLKGRIVDSTGKTVADAATFNDPQEPGLNQGMGAFTFTPVVNTAYELKIEAPVGIEGKFALPAVKADGVALAVPTGVTRDQEAIQVVLHSSRDREVLVGAYCRGRLLDFQQLTAKGGDATRVSLKPADGVGGVYRITVFERSKVGEREQLKPLAERLVYREPARRLNLAVRSDKREYLPGERVTLTVTGSSESSQAAPSVVLIGVVDKSVIKMADEKTARAMPTHFLLTSEVNRAEDLEHADILLTDHAKAPQALDLLLGTQGWRRFIESDPKRFEAEQNSRPAEKERLRDDVDRLMIASGRMQLAPAAQKRAVTSLELQEKQVIDSFKPKFDELQVRLDQVQHEEVKLAEPVEYFDRLDALRDQGRQAQSDYRAAVAVLGGYDDWNQNLRSIALLVFGAVLLVAGVGCVILAASRAMRHAVPYYAAAVGSVAICGLVLLATFMLPSDVPSLGTQVAMKNGRQDRSGQMLQEEALNFGNVPLDDLAEGKPRAGMGPGQGGGGGLFGGALGDAKGMNRQLDEQRARNEQMRGAAIGRVQPMAAPAAPPAVKAGADRPGLKLGEAKKADGGLQRNGMLQAEGGWAERQNLLLEMDKAKDKKQAPAAEKPAADRLAALDALRRDRNADGDNMEQGQAFAFRRKTLQNEALYKRAMERKEGEAADARATGAANAAGLAGKYARELAAAKASIAPTMIREYAHQHRTGDDPYIRSDFTETVYWHPALVLPDGKMEVSFQLPDSVTTFQVLAVGHTPDGRLGQVTSEFEATKPFTLDAKVPLEANANDVIDIPVAVRNASNEARTVHVTIDLEGLVLESSSDAERQLALQPQQGARVIFRVRPSLKEGSAYVRVKGHTHPFCADSVQQVIKIVPEGFPITEQASDLLERTAIHDIELPKEWVPQTLKAELTLYPSALADLQKGLEGLLREPSGCFEQTSTSNYPNVMILDYLRQTGQAPPGMEQRVRDMMSRGYSRLISYECQTADAGKPRQGYEWFGGRAPAHEALTAYGLLQFMDMTRLGHPVDQVMVQRTRDYLLSQRDGEGGFKRNARALDSFGRAPGHITNAYIIWAISEADKDRADKADLDKEIAALTKLAEGSKDPYFLALVANTLLNRSQDASAYLKKLTELQKPEGFLPGAEASITRSGGRDLLIESTALGVLAWLKANQPLEYHKNVQGAVKWIGQQRGGHGSFGSTQSTILALKALLAVARAKKGDSQEAGDLIIKIKDEVVARGRFNPNATEPIVLKLPEADRVLKAGKNEVTIELSGKSVVPYTLSWSYNTLTPRSAEACPIRLHAQVDRPAARDGETVHLHLTVANQAKQGQGMVVAIVGLPAGLELPPDFAQLKDYARLKNNGTEAGTISFFEVRGTRELVLYWRDLAPEQKVDLHLDLICKVPGDFRGPASRAYLYYNADHKHWIEPVALRITPKE